MPCSPSTYAIWINPNLRVGATTKQTQMKLLCLFFGFVLAPCGLAAQRADTLRISLSQAVKMAQSESALGTASALASYQYHYWQYQAFISRFRPSVALSATLPALQRNFQAITLPDGSDAFVGRSLMSNSAGVVLRQSIIATGGNVWMRTGLDRLDIFGIGGKPGAVSYLSTPLALGIEQPLFGFNRLRWDWRVEPLRWEEQQKKYAEALSENALHAAGLFLETLDAQVRLEAARALKTDADTLLAIVRGRFELGRVTLDEQLEAELKAVNAELAIARQAASWQITAEKLRDFLNIYPNTVLQVSMPSHIPNFIIDPHKAIQLARANRSAASAFERRLMEARMEVAKARAEKGLQVNLAAMVGVAQIGPDVEAAYSRLLDQERVALGITVPIADWGRARANLEAARALEALTEAQVSQERILFEREILARIQQFEGLQQQLSLARQAYELSRQRSEASRSRYLLSKHALSSYHLALREEEEALGHYLSVLRNFWMAYYDLQRLTLYDFEADTPLAEPPTAPRNR